MLMVHTLPKFFSLMEDGIVSLTGLLFIADQSCREYSRHVSISQLTLSLYLMAQCQLKLHHSLTSLAQTLDYIEVARLKVLYKQLTLDPLTLRLTEHKILEILIG